MLKWNEPLLLFDDQIGTNNTMSESSKFRPPIAETKKLESDILAIIQRLRDDEAGEGQVAKDEVISVLNRSLTALSHWVLQAQLMELDPNNQDRVAVENSLLKKEVEFLSGKASQKRLHPIQIPPSQLQEPSERPYKVDVQTPVKEKRKKKIDISQITPKRGEFSPKQQNTGTKYDVEKSPTGRSLNTRRTSGEPLSPKGLHEPGTQFKLVENKKPHPRMRRTSDNPSRNEYVRVFHLEKEK